MALLLPRSECGVSTKQSPRHAAQIAGLSVLKQPQNFILSCSETCQALNQAEGILAVFWGKMHIYIYIYIYITHMVHTVSQASGGGRWGGTFSATGIWPACRGASDGLGQGAACHELCRMS